MKPACITTRDGLSLLTTFAMLLASTVIASASQASASTPPGTNDAVKIMTFNIRYGDAHDGPNAWPRRRNLVFDVIRRRAPDVLGLQEALRYQIDEIRKALPVYDERGEAREGGQKGEYSAILYRRDRFEVGDSGTFWLSDTPEVPSASWGNVCLRVCTWCRFTDRGTGHAFYMYNTHLDHQSQPARAKGIHLIARRIAARKDDAPWILTGDFNAAEDNPAVRGLTGNGKSDAGASPLSAVDTFRVLHPDVRNNVGTYNGFHGTTSGAKIDYILVPRGTRVLDATIVHDADDGRCPSDHFPVTATVRFDSHP